MKVLKKNPNIHDNMMQIIAWILGEYGSTLPKEEKVTRILDKLCEAMSRAFEFEETKAWVMTAITKLHAGRGFSDNEKIAKVIDDYSSSKNVEVQQRVLEYKALKANSNTIPHYG